MAEAKGDNDFLVVGPIKADQELSSGELDMLQDKLSDEIFVVGFDAAPAGILCLELALQNDVRALRIVRVLVSFQQELVVVARDRYGYAFA